MSILKNTSIVVFGVVISNVLAYFFHLIAGRFLGPKEYGEFGSLMALFMMIALPTGALGFAITKYSSKYHSETDYGKIGTLRKKLQNDVLIFSVVLLILFILFSKLIANYLRIESSYNIIIVGITLVFAILLPVNRGVLQGMKKFREFSWNSIFEAIARLVFLVAFLYFGMRTGGAILSYGLAYLVSFVLVFPSIKETKKSAHKLDKSELKEIYIFSFKVLLVNVVLQSITNIPSLLVKHYYSAEFTGYWTAAMNIARISLFITGSFTVVLLPEIVGEKDASLRKRIFLKTSIWVIISASVVTVGLFVFSGLLINLLYGAQYQHASPLLGWMGVAMIFIGWLQLWVNYFLAKLG